MDSAIGSSTVGGLLQQMQFLQPGLGDMVEIFLVAFLIYRLLLLIQQTRAMQMLFGVGLLAALYLLAVIVDFALIRTIMDNLVQLGAIGAIVVFQPELRAALARLGQSRLVRLINPANKSRLVDQLVEGVEQLARTRVGAILAIQREVGLREYATTGSMVGARVSPDLLK